MTIIALSCEALPSDAAVRRFEADERLSAPFRARVEVATAQGDVELRTWLRQRALLSLRNAAGAVRCLDGVIERAHFVAHTGRLFHFAVELVPTLALLRYREDCRIFQEQSVIDVVTQVLRDAGVDQHEWRLQHDYPRRDMIVQYRESDLDFVSRLLEHEGIFYFFEHSADGHKLVLGDHPDVFAPQPALPAVSLALAQGLEPGSEPLQAFGRQARLRPARVLLRDFDYRTPQVKPEASAERPAAWPLSYYQAHADIRADDPAPALRARRRLDALAADADVSFGKSGAIGLCPGAPATVSGCAEECCNGEVVVTALRTRGEQGLEGEDGATCVNRFEAIAKGSPFAPPRRTPRPRIRGLQTAIVTGPTNEQQAIHCDELGRVKVRFHWDRAGIGDDKSSCWLRVAQIGLGGAMILPRVGWEVAVAFEDGDPDRPFVFDRLYNGKHRPMVSLPAKATCGALKSLSTPGGAGSNHLGTDDQGGSQGFDISAAKNLNCFIGADKSESVAVDETHTISSNLNTGVGGSESWTVGGDQSINVGNALQTKTGGAQSISVGGNETLGAKANYIEAIGGGRSYSIGGSRITISNGVRTLVKGSFSRSVSALQLNLSAGAINDGLASSYCESVGAVKAELVRGDSAENVGGDKHLTSTAAELHLVGELDMEAATVSRNVGGVQLTKCGGDYQVSAPQIALAGGVGQLKGGGASLKLNGGPIVASGSKITIESALLRRTAGSLKLE